LQTLDEELDGYGKEVRITTLKIIFVGRFVECRSYNVHFVSESAKVFINVKTRLCGFPPFYAEDDDEAFDQIISGEFEYPSPYWDGISDPAKDLINHLLVVNPPERFTAKEALKHKWIVVSDCLSIVTIPGK
jgi:serine/threonine protein kinase